jgi:Na+-driven multidrug efflux pump
VWVIYYFNSGLTPLRFRRRHMQLTLKLSWEIISIGFAPFALQLAVSVLNVLLNRALFQYGGDLSVAAMGIVYSILVMVIMPLQGLNQGVQPIIGYNYGAKKYDRVKRAFKLAAIAGTVFCVAGWIFAQTFPAFCVGLFHDGGGELLELGVRALHICGLCMPVIAFSILSSQFFQAIGKPVQGTVLGLSRQILFFIPLLFVLPRFFGLDGIFWVFPASDLCAFLLSVVMIRSGFRRL